MLKNSNTKKVKVTIVGKKGKMGNAIVSEIDKDPALTLSESGEVIIDFSTPEGTLQAISMGKPLVSGTTGLNTKHFELMKNLSKKVPVLYSPNFSYGVNLLFEIAKAYSHQLKNIATLSIEETHHTSKKDAPSGTALQLGELLEVTNITSNRVKETIGIHKLNILFDDEELILQHKANSRAAFAKGALNAVKFLLNRPPKLYQISDIFVENFNFLRV